MIDIPEMSDSWTHQPASALCVEVTEHLKALAATPRGVHRVDATVVEAIALHVSTVLGLDVHYTQTQNSSLQELVSFRI